MADETGDQVGGGDFEGDVALEALVGERQVALGPARRAGGEVDEGFPGEPCQRDRGFQGKRVTGRQHGDRLVPCQLSYFHAVRAARAGRRILVVGGAGPLRSPDDPDRAVADNSVYVFPAWRSIAVASAEQLRQCEDHSAADWVYLSPPTLLEPGERTGTYRRGTDTLLTDGTGASRVSAEDLACAVLDELGNRGPDRWFTVAEGSARP